RGDRALPVHAPVRQDGPGRSGDPELPAEVRERGEDETDRGVRPRARAEPSRDPSPSPRAVYRRPGVRLPGALEPAYRRTPEASPPPAGFSWRRVHSPAVRP